MTSGYSKNGKKLGRPKKTEIEAKSRGGRGKVGRPKGDAAIMNEYKARMLARRDNQKLIDKMYEIAQDDDHKHQAAVLKMLMDRMLPVRAFEEDVTKNKGKSAVTVTINTMGGSANVSDTVDGEWEELDGDVSG
jgi:hypothetical protein